MPTRLACLVLLLPVLTGCHSPGHGPAWDALVDAGRLTGEVTAADDLALSFRAELPGPGEIADGPMLVLIHGWCGEGRVWGGLAEPPWSRHNVVSLDLAGHGASVVPRADLSLQAFAADVVQLLDHLGLSEAILVGHGLGAVVAVQAAALRPQAVRGVVAVECFHDLSQEYTVEQATLMENAFRNDFAGTMDFYLDWLVGRESRAEWVPRLAETMSSVPLHTALGTLRSAFLCDVRRDLAVLPVPLVLVNGDQRPTHLAALRRLVPGAAAEIVNAAGHFPQLERPLEFGLALDRALATIAAQREASS